MWNNPGNYVRGDLYLLPKKIDEHVARLHLGQIGAKLSTLSAKQADYLSVQIDGPFKTETYRY
jgi:adenosylhomocysteinase